MVWSTKQGGSKTLLQIGLAIPKLVCLASVVLQVHPYFWFIFTEDFLPLVNFIHLSLNYMYTRNLSFCRAFIQVISSSACKYIHKWPIRIRLQCMFELYLTNHSTHIDLTHKMDIFDSTCRAVVRYIERTLSYECKYAQNVVRRERLWCVFVTITRWLHLA